MVNAGPLDPDTETLGFVEVDTYLTLDPPYRRQKGGHELGRVLGLEVGGPISDEGVGRRMVLVEAVIGKFEDKVPDFLGTLAGYPVHDRPFQELILHLDKQPQVFLAHGPAQYVRFAQGQPCNPVGDLEDLLLVNHYTVGFTQHRFKLGM